MPRPGRGPPSQTPRAALLWRSNAGIRDVLHPDAPAQEVSSRAFRNDPTNRLGPVECHVLDESLLAAMASGDADAAAAFVRRYQARVYGLALTVVGDPASAEEVAQETFLRIWRNAVVYDVRRGRVATWVLTITRNLAIDALRVRRERPIDPHELVSRLLAQEQPKGEGADVGDREQLREALRALPPEQSRMVVLSVFCGLTAKESADLEGIPLGTAKTRIRRGIARLRQELGVGGD
jgi:RNA polymerase sigma factor (sigma-70 family)